MFHTARTGMRCHKKCHMYEKIPWYEKLIFAFLEGLTDLKKWEKRNMEYMSILTKI